MDYFQGLYFPLFTIIASFVLIVNTNTTYITQSNTAIITSVYNTVLMFFSTHVTRPPFVQEFINAF